MAEKRTGNTVQINASIPKDLLERLKIIAKHEKRSLSNLIALLLEDSLGYFKKEGGDGKD